MSNLLSDFAARGVTGEWQNSHLLFKENNFVFSEG